MLADDANFLAITCLAVLDGAQLTSEDRAKLLATASRLLRFADNAKRFFK
jgi:hypothetical protein